VRRGEVWLVNLDPVLGSETGKRRPAVIIQNDLANQASPTVTVVPLITSTDRVFPFQVLVPAGEGGIPRASKALCEQIRTVSRLRMERCLGRLSDERLAEIRIALDRHLWFEALR
jgi:mRNA interferase MazF